jgi:hypothetical protein
LSSYALPFHSPRQKIREPSDQSVSTVVPCMYRAITAGSVRARHTASDGASISTLVEAEYVCVMAGQGSRFEAPATAAAPPPGMLRPSTARDHGVQGTGRPVNPASRSMGVRRRRSAADLRTGHQADGLDELPSADEQVHEAPPRPLGEVARLVAVGLT